MNVSPQKMSPDRFDLEFFLGSIKTFPIASSVRVVESIQIEQFGLSYKVQARHNKGHSLTCFLKMPEGDVDRISRDALRDRFIKEWKRGSDLNDLADTIRSSGASKTELRFELPKLIGAGTIKSVNADAGHAFCGLPFIIYEWVEGVQLDTVLNVNSRTPFNGQHLIKNKQTGDALRLRARWFEFARGLANVVRRLHNHGFLHAYIVPRNILISFHNNEPVSCALAGFGYSALSIEESLEPSKTIPADEPFQSPEFSSRRPLDALWHPSDIYSIGAVLLCLAIGQTGNSEYLSKILTVQSGVDDLKRRVREALNEAKTSLNAEHNVISRRITTILANDNIAKIIDNCLRYDPDDRIATAEELIEAIDIAETQPITDQKRRSQIGPFFSSVLKQKKQEFEAFEDRLKKGHHFEIWGSRTRIIEGLCRMLGSLPPDAIYCTITLPSYWTNENLGPDGRFLAMNKYVARRGVAIQRIFLVSGAYHSLSDTEQNILRKQLEAVEELRKQGHDNFEVKVQLVSPLTIHGFERQGNSVAFVAWRKIHLTDLQSKKGKPNLGQFLCLNFISRGDERDRYGKKVIEREIKKVRIWDPFRSSNYQQRLCEEVNRFTHSWGQASTLNLEQYIGEGSSLTLEQLLKGERSS